MTLVGWVLVIILVFLGFLSCFINKIPGPLLVAIATLLAKAMIGLGNWGLVAAVFALAIAAMIASKYMSKFAKEKLFPYSKGASVATTVGCILGLIFLIAGREASVGVMIFLLILGFLILPFAFSFGVEYAKQKNTDAALKSAGSCCAVYLADTMLKLAVVYIAVRYVMFG